MTTNTPAPIMFNRLKAVTGALFVVLILASCSHTPTPQELTGMWATVPVVTARGTTSEEFCFSADGSVTWNTQTPGRTAKQRGTYKLVGDVLTIETPDLEAPLKLTSSMNLGKLVLTSPKGTTQKYSKVGASCDDQGK